MKVVLKREDDLTTRSQVGLVRRGRLVIGLLLTWLDLSQLEMKLHKVNFVVK